MKQIKTNKRIEKTEQELISEGFVKMVDHSDYFWINSDGRIYNFKNQKFRGISLTEDGYYDTSISNGVYSSKSYPLHRLLAHYFIPNKSPDVTTDINHIDGNKSNNELSNLEWVIHQENMIHSARNGLRIYADGKGRSHLDETKVKEIKKLIYQGYTHSEIAKLFNTSRPCITQIASGNRWAEVTIDTNGLKKLDRKQITDYKTLKVIINGEEKTLYEFAEQYNINVGQLKQRYQNGLRDYNLLKTPHEIKMEEITNKFKIGCKIKYTTNVSVKYGILDSIAGDKYLNVIMDNKMRYLAISKCEVIEDNSSIPIDNSSTTMISSS